MKSKAVEQPPIQEVIARWRDKLINLTGSNRLLRFRPTKTSTVRFSHPALDEALQRLHRPGSELKIVPLREGRRDDGLREEGAEGIDSVLDELAAAQATQDVAEDSQMLGADLEPVALANVLRNLTARASQTFTDTGLWTLYLAVGTISYAERDEPGTLFRSPLVLLPVALERPNRRAQPKLTLLPEDPIANPALALKFSSLGIDLPPLLDTTPEGLLAYLASVESLAAQRQGWSVEESLELSYFTFHKEAMYRDLIENQSAVLESELVVALAQVGLGTPEEKFRFDPVHDERIDQEDPPERAFQILDADASQRAAIIAAVEGKSFVLDGPPGTGKSQTIANIIASLIPRGQSVLFVSEKAAALDVVKQRLEECGLGSFVLELHSHKAARKEVAAELNRAVSAKPVSSGNMQDTDRQRLEKARKSLSAWSAAMNTKREPLGVTLHRAMGEVALREGLTATSACSGDLRGATAERLADIQMAAGELSRAWRPALEGSGYLWRDVQSEQPIGDQLRRAHNAFTALAEYLGPFDNLMSQLDVAQISQLGSMLALVERWNAGLQDVPEAWLLSHDFAGIEKSAELAAVLISELNAASLVVQDRCEERWQEHYDGMSDGSVEALGAPGKMSPSFGDLGAMSLGELCSLSEAVATFGRQLSGLATASTELATQLGLERPSGLADIARIKEIHDLSDSADRPERLWLKNDLSLEVRKALEALKPANAACVDAEEAASKFFLPSILGIDIRSLHARFANVHRGLKKFSASYRHDRGLLAGMTAPGTSLKVAIGELSRAEIWLDAQTALDAAEVAHAEVLGSRYDGRTTDWAALEAAAHATSRLSEIARPVHKETFLDAVANGGPRDVRRNDLANRVSETLSEVQESIDSNLRLSRGSVLRNMALDGILSWCAAAQDALSEAVTAFEAICKFSNSAENFAEARLTADAILRFRAAENALTAAAPNLARMLQTSFSGKDTDCERLKAQIASVRDFKAIMESSFGARGSDGAVSRELLSELKHATSMDSLHALLGEWKLACDAVVGAFAEPRRSELSESLDAWSEADDVLRDFLEDPTGQEDWAVYRSSLTTLSQFGLLEVVDSAARAGAPAVEVPDLLLRETYRRWADQVLESEPHLRKGRAADRDALVEEFQRLDRQLVEFAVAEIIHESEAFRPTLAAGEVGIIQREGARKARHMPIRDLIGQTRHVTRAVKPVFMMSPLSVSQYLPSDLRFDVVIFDEASQVKPEDAINCIYRGSRLIIAGDDKQLPPTNFFDFDDGDSDGGDALVAAGSAAADFDSVLTIAKGSGAFTSLTLKWHYRSRHEALIAFSNHRFYAGDLITFPSSHSESADLGVKYFHVPNGSYDRGGSRRNMVEARFVAERVEHHFTTRPGMSLGVVAFSQQQASAIEAAVDEMLLRRPDLESYFSGERLHGFFVKNLESVQGDERDVMIFTLGYGPDASGKMTMNFGPMNREDGWRRLNVAVTRARFRNEIVASFVPGEIIEGGSRGIRELRTFLDYAVRGIAALDLTSTESLGDAESPFEESVLDWLRSEGHVVSPQIGASGYRIDMAVHDPRFPARFLLGVECDGAAYHSSRTARDRDRIRAQVLRGLGWNLHRIWGTAWYRNRDQEQARLKQAIDRALTEPHVGLLAQANPPSRRADVALESVDLTAVAQWVEHYTKTDVARPPRGISPSSPESIPHLRRSIQSIVEAEGPVHIEVIDARLREAWSFGRIGGVIRANIERAIAGLKVQRDGDFLYAGEFAERLPTRCHDDSTKRDIRHVHLREVEDTAYRVARDAGAIGREELVVVTARYLGFARVGADVRAAVEQAISRLVDQEWLEEDGDRFLAFVPEA